MKWMYNRLTGGKTEMLPFWWILPFRKEKGEGGQWYCRKQGLYLIVQVHSIDRMPIAPAKRFHLYCYETGSMLESDFSLGFNSYDAIADEMTFLLFWQTQWKKEKVELSSVIYFFHFYPSPLVHSLSCLAVMDTIHHRIKYPHRLIIFDAPNAPPVSLSPICNLYKRFKTVHIGVQDMADRGFLVLACLRDFDQGNPPLENNITEQSRKPVKQCGAIF